jgi:collagen triple helix repeat protein
MPQSALQRRASEHLQRLSPRVTFSGVTSLLALLVALGGVSYAAVELPNNSVKSRHIAKSAVRSADLKDGSVQPRDLSRSVKTRLLGSAGPPGAAGPIGPAGLPGAQGPKGDTGAPGPKGDTGAQGPKGDTGARGPKGDTGAQGATGAPGTQGPPGTARSYGLVQSNGQLVADRSKNAGVLKTGTGFYCVLPSGGVDPSTTTIVATLSADSIFASLDRGISIRTDPCVVNGLGSGFVVETYLQNASSVHADLAFTFMIP